jgi:hypothetical protein
LSEKTFQLARDGTRQGIKFFARAHFKWPPSRNVGIDGCVSPDLNLSIDGVVLLIPFDRRSHHGAQRASAVT